MDEPKKLDYASPPKPALPPDAQHQRFVGCIGCPCYGFLVALFTLPACLLWRRFGLTTGVYIFSVIAAFCLWRAIEALMQFRRPR